MQQILSILGSIGFNWHVALANFINFLIILFLLNKYFFGKIGKVIDERQEIIKRGLNDAVKAEKALANATEEKQDLLRDAEKESHQILVEAKERGEMIASNIKREADKEIGMRLESLKVKEETINESVESSFSKKAPELVAKLYALTLSREMTEDENNALLNRMSN